MAVRYNKLLKMLIDKNMSNAQLAAQAAISGNIMTKIKRGRYISLDTAEKICKVLSCGVDDILEFVPDEDDR